jgi:hypothetical protein
MEHATVLTDKIKKQKANLVTNNNYRYYCNFSAFPRAYYGIYINTITTLSCEIVLWGNITTLSP